MSKPRTINSLSTWADGHEVLCDERHGNLKMRLTRIEGILIVVAGAMLAGGGSMIWQLLKISAHLEH